MFSVARTALYLTNEQDLHIGREAVAHQLLGDLRSGLDAHVDDERTALAGETGPILLG